ncbi:MAG: DUF4263 domain-containing protein [Kiritimatiellae bacterium]|nr:DUF4263 domain-containing protein [Kiritimatiellia bacterium]MDD5520729.1 DUF4263 domain-containing protein [Kiritimatiellia bacterium]
MSIPDWFYIEHKDKSIDIDRQNTSIVLSALDELISQIRAGWNEQQVQNFLKKRPFLLAGRFRVGHGTYAFSELSFGGKYYADWLLASGHSGGITWELIELECPQATPFMEDGHFSEATRKGLNQIQDWRNWIQRNLDTAGRSIAEEGLGLYDIRSQIFGLVVVGQSSRYGDAAAYNKNRNNAYDQNHIRIESYDSFINSLRFGYEDHHADRP